MTQYNTLNVKLFNSQLYKLKSGIKNRNEVTLNLSLNVIGESNDETNFPHTLLSTHTQVILEYEGFLYFTASSAVIPKCGKTFFRKIKEIIVLQVLQVPS